ncbi:MAG: NAD(P)/FAD-dependent oxidoreductase [Pseudomonadota bacterium]
MRADYLISGAGATALSFLDVLLSETDATAVVVDRRDAPGGHWNDAYPFVRLHQSASFYGVNSRPLAAKRTPGQDYLHPHYELSTKSEILHYFHDLMSNSYQASGRVTYLRNSEHLGDGRVRHLITGRETQVEVAKKIVHAGVWGDKGSIPSMHTPKFEIAKDAHCVPINDLPRHASAHRHFTVIGAGKTGMDAAVWLLEQGVEPHHIRWIRPNDYWLFNRESILNHPDRFTTTVGAFLSELEALASVSNVSDFCVRMEENGVWHRIDPNVTPTKFHAAVCSPREVEMLARIKDVVRLGRVTRIEHSALLLDKGRVQAQENSLYIDCSASAGIVMEGKIPRVFEDDRTINLNLIRPFQPLFSAALIAFLEARVSDPKLRNACTYTVNFHDTPAQYIKEMLPAIMNQGAWSKVPELKSWMEQSRLQAVTHLMEGFDPSDEEKIALLSRFGPASKAAVMNIPNILAAVA